MKWIKLYGSLNIFWHCPSLGLEWKVFQSYGLCWVFQICWHIKCSTLIRSSFRIWNSSARIPSPPLALFIILPRAHVTSHSKMSGSRWVTIPPWLSGSFRPFLYSSAVYSCHLFLISSAFVRSLPFLSFIVQYSIVNYRWNIVQKISRI